MYNENLKELLRHTTLREDYAYECYHNVEKELDLHDELLAFARDNIDIMRGVKKYEKLFGAITKCK